ncbi:MAG: hypothetical protein ACR2Q4_10995 [Geminicoccaceae bacterium]
MLKSPDLSPLSFAIIPLFVWLSIAAWSLTMPPVQAAEAATGGAKIETPVKPVNLSADGPDIVLIEPEEGGTYTSPIGIEISFKPEGAETVDVETLKVTVVSKTAIGIFESDITEDIVPFASSAGIQAPKAEIPAGDHVVTIQVADSAQRYAERQLSITVREESVLERRAKE